MEPGLSSALPKERRDCPVRIDFAEKDEDLEEINWDDFFAIFDDRNLAFLYEDAGSSRFNKFVDADKNA